MTLITAYRYRNDLGILDHHNDGLLISDQEEIQDEGATLTKNDDISSQDIKFTKVIFHLKE